MSPPPADDPISFDRSKLRQAPKKSSSPVFKILLILFGGGFLICAGCGGWFAYNVYQGVQMAKNGDPDNGARSASGEEGFKQANLKIAVGSGATAHGNSDEARKLAENFSTDFQTLREAFFTKRKKKPVFSLTSGEFLTYCHLDDKACVFLVHVPDLRKFTADAKSDLADLAWVTAQNVVRSNLENPPPRLAIGTRGALLYGHVLIGTFQSEEGGEGEGIDIRESGVSPEKQLYQFFRPEMVPATPAAADSPSESEMPGDGEPDAKPDDGESQPEDAPRGVNGN